MASSTPLRRPDPDGPAATPTPASPWQLEPDLRLLVLGVLLVSAVYVLANLGRGWIPWDDGALAQSAERLNQGQLPHRDFDEIYTGGLTWVNAAAFRLLGTTLWTLRVVLFAVFLAWVPAVYYTASRFVRPLAAAGVTLLAVVWSVPNYSAALPSWYNLFLATFGIAALLRHLEDGRRRWLVIAGIAGGLSFIVKIAGLYYIAGVLLFVVFQAHAKSRAAAGPEPKRETAYGVFVSLSLLLFVGALWSVVRHEPHAPEIVQFVLPGALLAALLVRNEWTSPAGESRARFATLARLVVPFLIGVAVPIVLLLVPYARAGAFGAFANGVFVLPMKRFSGAYFPALPLETMVALVPLGILLVLAHRAKRGIGRREIAMLSIVLIELLVVTSWSRPLYKAMWNIARNLLPVLAVCGVAILARERVADRGSPLLRGRLMLLLSVTALCGLVQFPFSAPIYFCYVAPLVALTALALHSYMRPTAGAVSGLLMAFFAAFAVLRINFSPLPTMGVRYQEPYPMAPLTLERAGIDVVVVQQMEYEELIPLLRRHARGGYTWASPDTPEIYFLAGLKNPTRSLFELFEDSTNANERVLRALDAHGVTAIVLNAVPSFSPMVSEQMFDQLAKRYPHARNVGIYQLRWRD